MIDTGLGFLKTGIENQPVLLPEATCQEPDIGVRMVLSWEEAMNPVSHHLSHICQLKRSRSLFLVVLTNYIMKPKI